MNRAETGFALLARLFENKLFGREIRVRPFLSHPGGDNGGMQSEKFKMQNGEQP